MRAELTRCPSCGMSVTTWVRDDEIEADAILRELHLRADITRVRAALQELVEANKGMISMPDPAFNSQGEETNAKRLRWQSAIAKAKEVLGNG